MNKFDELVNLKKFNDLIGKKEEKKCCNTLLWIFAIIGVIAAIAGIAYAIYYYFTPDYLEDFEDDFEDEDDFELSEDEDDDIFEDEGEN